jgi:DNA polymerase III delta prime subunit
MPFVGREQVLGQAIDALGEAAEGRGSVVVFSGEPGIGKTRAAEMLAREATRNRSRVAFGYCRAESEAPPLWPFAQLARELFLKAPLLDRAREQFPELAVVLPELAAANGGRRDYSASSAALDAPKYPLFDAFVRLFARATDDVPSLLLVLDDLHQADAATLELANYLSDEIARTRILLVATVRDFEASRSAYLARLVGHGNSTRIPLPRLEQAEVASYLELLLGNADRAVSRTVFEKSEGNPFFMTELARQIRRAADQSQALEIPASAREIVRQRVAKLDIAARGALSIAAVIGRTFHLGVLQSASGRAPDALMASLDEAVESGVITPARGSLTEFSFGHELLRDVLYDALDKGERRRYHARVGIVLEERAAAGEVVPAADLAYHFRSALPASDPRKTVTHCVEAAKEATSVYAYADAERFIICAREATELLEAPSPRLRIRLMLQQALLTLAHSADAYGLIQQVLKLSREHRAADSFARAAMLLDPHPGFGPTHGARLALEEALEALPPDASLRAAVMARLSISAPLAYDAAASQAQLAAAESLAQSSPAILDRYSTIQARLYLYGGPGFERVADSALRAFSNVCREHPSLLVVPPLLMELHRALHALQRGDLVTMERAVERGARRGHLVNIDLHWHFRRFRALALVNAGERAEGAAVLVALHLTARQESVTYAELLCCFDEVVVLAAHSSVFDSRWAAALEPDPDDPPSIWSIKVRALAAAGMAGEALAALELVPPERLAALPRDRDYLGTLGALARAALALNAREYCVALLALLAPHRGMFAAHLSFLCEGSVSQLLGLLASAVGLRSEARANFEAALVECERAGLENCAAEVRLQLAQLDE